MNSKRGISRKRQAINSKSKNLLNIATCTVNTFVRYFTGELASSQAGNISSDFIPVDPETVYTVTGGRNAQNAGSSFYDKDKVFISGIQVSSFTTPANCAYVRTTINSSYINTAQVEKSSEATGYDDYKQVKPVNRVLSVKR
ncbi:hypothetical protein [Priestia megaterium]|uniref:hypothetical protein n=1 Tax=Priestia megaterium TaxID=1404 RepID=UPI002E233BF1|nr:hypothetical protein [Priestia megaterium]